MKKIKYYFISALALSCLNAAAQRTCGSHEYLLQQLAQHPEMLQERQRIEQLTRDFSLQQSGSAQKGTTVLYNIPVVVHVLYNTTTQNISDAQILSQITQLNKDYQLLNTDASLVPTAFSALKADCQISFCMAQRTPTGTATTGIIRKSTTKTTFNTNTDDAKYSSLGGDDAWPAAQYLNLWVVPSITSGTSSGVLGYAQFPGGAAATDGVVIAYNCFGTTGTATAPFNLGRTATHEIGHWLNLLHIWGDDAGACTGDDLVGDTPNQGDHNFGCPTFPTITCSNGPNGDMFMNYMDYSNDACMYMFSSGQKTRMQALFATGGPRVSILTSSGCTPPTSGCVAPVTLNASSMTQSAATLSWSAVTGVTGYNLQWKTAAATTWTSVSSLTATTYALSGLAANTTYNFHVQSKCGSGSSATTSAYSATFAFTTPAPPPCVAPTGLTAANINATGASLSWVAVPGATGYNLQWKTAAATSWTTVSSLTATSYALNTLAASTAYTYQVQTKCSGTTTSAYSTPFAFTTLAPCADNNEPNESTTAAKLIAVNTVINAKIGSSTDKDYFKFTNTTAAPKFKVILDNLPLNYDMKLYNTNGTALIATSANLGTTAEAIVYNTTVVGTYYIYVYGTNTIWNASNCYSLQVQTGSANFRDTADEEFIRVAAPGLRFYPNPSTGMVNFELNARSEQTATMVLTDQSGRLCRSVQVHLEEGRNMSSVDLTALPSGLYFIRMVTVEGTLVSKLMLER